MPREREVCTLLVEDWQISISRIWENQIRVPELGFHESEIGYVPIAREVCPISDTSMEREMRRLIGCCIARCRLSDLTSPDTLQPLLSVVQGHR